MRSYKSRWLVVLGLCGSHFAVFAFGRFLGKPPGMLHREMALEFAYFEVEFAVKTGDPMEVLNQVDNSLRVFSRPLYMLGVDKKRASIEQSFLYAIRARALAALHRDAEANSAAEDASKACIRAGRQSCDPSRLVDFSKHLLNADWDSPK